jgi:hypothetical protein
METSFMMKPVGDRASHRAAALGPRSMIQHDREQLIIETNV